MCYQSSRNQHTYEKRMAVEYQSRTFGEFTISHKWHEWLNINNGGIIKDTVGRDNLYQPSKCQNLSSNITKPNKETWSYNSMENFWKIILYSEKVFYFAKESNA